MIIRVPASTPSWSFKSTGALIFIFATTGTGALACTVCYISMISHIQSKKKLKNEIQL